MERGEDGQVVLHLRLGQISEKRFNLLLQRGLLGEHVLGCCADVARAEVGMVGDVEEALAIL